MENKNKFEWGQSVKVKKGAPAEFFPGEIVSICGITKVNSKKIADKYDSKVGEWVYTIEYIGGADTEIPERYLEPYEENS